MPDIFKKIRLPWLFLCGGYIIFIFIFSFLFPYGMDEYLGSNLSLSESFMTSFMVFMRQSSKIGVWVSGVVLYSGKWLFLLINPLVQMGIVFGLFYFIHGRKPDFKTFKDFSVFLLLAILSIFAVAAPDSTIFWLGGAVNYSWTFLFFIWYMCVLRAMFEGQPLFGDNMKIRILTLLWGLFCGMSNENNGPMVLLLTFCFYVFIRFVKKESLPLWFYFFFGGAFAGVIIMLFGPGLHARMKYDAVGFGIPALKEKMFFHINHMHNFIKANLLLPAVNFVALLILGIDWDKKAFKNKDYLLSLLCYIISWTLIAVLFVAPDTGWRPFYSGSLFSIVSFVLMLKYLSEDYKLNFFKYITTAAVIAAVLILPLITVPYVSLYRQSLERDALVSQARTRGAKVVFLPYYLIERGPLPNFTIVFFDAIYSSPEERYQYYKIPVIPVKNMPDRQDEIIKITAVY